MSVRISQIHLLTFINISFSLCLVLVYNRRQNWASLMFSYNSFINFSGVNIYIYINPALQGLCTREGRGASDSSILPSSNKPGFPPGTAKVLSPVQSKAYPGKANWGQLRTPPPPTQPKTKNTTEKEREN